jgi:hypothetical protein
MRHKWVTLPLPPAGSITPLLFHICIENRERSTSRPSCITGNQTQHPLYRRPNGPQSQCELHVRRENSFTYLHSIPVPPSSNIVVKPYALSQIPKWWERQRSKKVYFGAGCMSRILRYSLCICLLFLIIVLPPYPQVICSRTYRVYVKLRIIPNATYNVIFV